MDLQKHAQWHLDFNGGLVPILELPSGKLIPESGIIIAFAEEAGKNDHKLIPSDPVVAADMRIAMNKFESVFDDSFWGVYNTRHQDAEKLTYFKENGLKHFEEMC
jgi:glutathione S-transferase